MAILVGALVVTGVSARRVPASSGMAQVVRVPAAQRLPPTEGREEVSHSASTTTRGRNVPAPDWVARTSSTSGIPAPAVRAYGAAALDLATERPDCHLGWTTLAGIGAIESRHGTIGGRTLSDDGRSSRPVVGPTLDGNGGFSALAPTEATASIHRDQHFDHAVGPLQFVGVTWRDWAADGDGDERLDPLDLDDATLAAGLYLCADAHDLATAEGWHAAVYSYNHSEDYVLAVLSTSNRYARRVG